MTYAAIDVGSNTVRMLLAEKDVGQLKDKRYFRQVTRLSGDYCLKTGLASSSMERTIQALEMFAEELKTSNVQYVRTVGTAALRRAPNSKAFTDQLFDRTGLSVDIVEGADEAALSCCGILSVLDPVPQHALLFDIGGGSTELILVDSGCVLLQTSLPLGVVRLQEEQKTLPIRQQHIMHELAGFFSDPVWQKLQESGEIVELVGTAGTVTTLAAMNLQMTKYDSERVNNLILSQDWLFKEFSKIQSLSLSERVLLPGMEEGRADLIIPGLQIIMELFRQTRANFLRVSDAGLLEGILLEKD